jgi:hypothetical protein
VRADGYFRWGAKNVCLPNGGPSNSPSPPANTDCPYNWSWHTGKGCCAPHNPPSTLPPPQCPRNWNWNTGSFCCNPPPSPPTPPHSTPSQAPGQGNYHHKRNYRSRNVAPCPKGLSACPISNLTGGDYECVDTLVDLDNCGGCATSGEGQDCNAILGVWNVGCEQSACKSELLSSYPLLVAHLTVCGTSLYVRGWLHAFQGRKVLQRSLNVPVVRSTANGLDLLSLFLLRNGLFLIPSDSMDISFILDTVPSLRYLSSSFPRFFGVSPVPPLS